MAKDVCPVKKKTAQTELCEQPQDSQLENPVEINSQSLFQYGFHKMLNPDSSTASRGNYSVRFLPNTADMVLTIPLNPAGPFLSALASRMSSNSS